MQYGDLGRARVTNDSALRLGATYSKCSLSVAVCEMRLCHNRLRGFTPKTVGTKRQATLDSTRYAIPEGTAKFRGVEFRETYDVC